MGDAIQLQVGQIAQPPTSTDLSPHEDSLLNTHPYPIVPRRLCAAVVRSMLIQIVRSYARSRSATMACFCIALSGIFGLSGCVGPLNQRLVYEAKGIQVGIEADHTVDLRATPPVLNSHPAKITTEEVRTLLGSLEVSGWTGIIVGIFETPQPKPVFGGAALANLAEQFAKAFSEATPADRVYFSLQNPTARYETDRTAGSMFIRDGYLHFILWDHYGFEKADPGGGERRDPRDTKGMRLWVTRPAQSASVPEDKEPHWSSFEKVHISLNVREVLTALRGTHGVTKPPAASPAPAAAVSASPIKDATAPAPGNHDTVQQQIQELGNANQQLRTQSEQQTKELEQLKEELRRIREDMKSAKDSKSTLERTPSRKKPAP